MSTELKACVKCRSKEVRIRQRYNFYYILCSNCDTHTKQSFYRLELAIEAWKRNLTNE